MVAWVIASVESPTSVLASFSPPVHVTGPQAVMWNSRKALCLGRRSCDSDPLV